MFEFFRSMVPIVAPIFVVSTMLNVGLTQTLSDITGHLKNYSFVLKVLVANFVIAPLLMIAVLHFAPFDPALKAGLLIFSLCAGAPFLIKLTQTAKHDLSLGAAVMMLLMVVTVVYTPIVLPPVLSGISVDGWAVANHCFCNCSCRLPPECWLRSFCPTLQERCSPGSDGPATSLCTFWSVRP
jgi:BASS family bile acid:Na+ symporter